MISHVSTKSADYLACNNLGEMNLHQHWHRNSVITFSIQEFLSNFLKRTLVNDQFLILFLFYTYCFSFLTIWTSLLIIALLAIFFPANEAPPI